MTSLVSANAPSLTATPPPAQCRTDVAVSLGYSRLPPRSAPAWRAMKSSCAAMVASTVCGPAFSHAVSSSQMNTRYSAISAARNLADLDADPAPQARAAAGQAGGLVSVGRGYDDI